MNIIFRFKPFVALVLIAALTFSCSSDDNEDLKPADGEVFDAELIVTESNVGDKRLVTVNGGTTGTTIKAKVKFSSTTKSMRRLYITQDTGGAGEIPFVFTSQEVDEKPDGSLDLVGGDKKDFEFKINFPAPTLSTGTIVYRLWATTGRGDFRNVAKRNALGDDDMGTIIIKYGEGTNSSSGIKSFTKTILSAPLGDGSSKTFISLYNETVYKINQGEEYAALWDFGYYYGKNNKASLASTYDYPKAVIDVPAISKVAKEELNKGYFARSTKTIADFDAIKNSTDLDFITASLSERVLDLREGNIIEYVDSYGNKGLIKVVEISGTDGTGDFIKLDIKIQN
ncbi:hypothetical protein [Aquimarina longa]|uniref:hypothetical protein n=1 Tax=Aquimarina longa TaxID=1080221 RepID=UPI0007848DA5|nr:hypothetical protein [Aquimarina longa]